MTHSILFYSQKWASRHLDVFGAIRWYEMVFCIWHHGEFEENIRNRRLLNQSKFDWTSCIDHAQELNRELFFEIIESTTLKGVIHLRASLRFFYNWLFIIRYFIELKIKPHAAFDSNILLLTIDMRQLYRFWRIHSHFMNTCTRFIINWLSQLYTEIWMNIALSNVCVIHK